MEKYSLEELCSIITDGTHQTPEYSEDGYIFLSSKDVTMRKINWENTKKIPKQLHEILSVRLKPKLNDILLAKNGTTGVAAIVDRDEVFDIYVSLALLRPNEMVYPKYLLYAINSPQTKRQFDGGLKGIGVPNLHLSVIRKTKVPLPQYRNQQEIVRRLETVDKLIEIEREQIIQYDNLIKSRFIEMFGDPILNPKKWPMIGLGTLTSIGSSKRIFEKEYVDSGIPFYRTKEIVELSKGNLISTELYIAKERFDDIKDKYGVPKAGDLLISAVGTIGVIWIVDGKNDFYFKDGNLIRVDSSEKFNSVYMKELLENLIVEYKKQISSGTAYTALTISGLTNMMVYDVPIRLQNKFAAFVHQVEKLKSEEQKRLEKTQTLFDSLMQKYFG